MRPNVPLGHPAFGKAVPCRCQRAQDGAQLLQRLQRYSNLGSLSHITLRETDPKGRIKDTESQRLFQEAYQVATQFGQSPEGWLVLAGPSGCGKTHLAAAIANACIENGHPAFFITVPDLLDHLRAAYAPESPVSYDDLFEQVRNAPILVLDELGSHTGTPWAQEKLHQVLNHRFNSRLPTVIALSVPPGQLEERLRTRLVEGDCSRVLILGRKPAPLLEKVGGLDDRMLKSMTFDQFDIHGNRAGVKQQHSLQAALEGSRAYARYADGWLLLTGPIGCGKTHLAVSIANYRLERGLPVFFAVVPDLLDHLRSTFAPNSPVSYDQVFEHIKDTPFLILDDLGYQSSTAWAEEKLYQIVLHRHNLRLPTVITLREDIELNPAISSRLNDPRTVQVLEIDAPDYRAQSLRASAEGHRPEPRSTSGPRRRSPDRAR